MERRLERLMMRVTGKCSRAFYNHNLEVSWLVTAYSGIVIVSVIVSVLLSSCPALL